MRDYALAIGADFGPTHDEESIVSTLPRELARDAHGRLGEVMDRFSTRTGVRVWLRPLGGGREWEVDGSTITLVERDAEMEPNR